MASGAAEAGDLIEELYAGALAPEALAQALGRAVKCAGASGGNIHVVDKATLETLMFTPWGPRYSREAIEIYFRHWRHVNVHRAAMRRTRGVFLCHEQLSDAVLARAPYAQDFYFAMGERWLAGAVAHDAGHEVSLVFNRSAGQKPFDESAKRLITDLLPHVRRAGSAVVRGALKHALHGGLGEGLAHSSHPAWLVDPKLCIIWCNPAGEALMGAAGAIAVRAGRLELSESADQDQLNALVLSAVNRRLEGAAAQAMLVEQGDKTIELEIMPATAPDGALHGARSLAMVLGRELGLRADAALRLRARFKLSVAEAALAVEIATGAELDAIARAREVSPRTVRTQLRHIYNKTGACRQAELTALVWRIGG